MNRINNKPFWELIPLSQMTPQQWESLCDGCARCCLQKLQDGRSGKVYYTQVACRFLDIDRCRCTVYDERAEREPGCSILNPETLPRLRWLPASCAYRRILLGKALPDWHPLVSGNPRSVEQAGMSIRHMALSLPEASTDALLDHVIDWEDIDF